MLPCIRKALRGGVQQKEYLTHLLSGVVRSYLGVTMVLYLGDRVSALIKEQVVTLEGRGGKIQEMKSRGVPPPLDMCMPMLPIVLLTVMQYCHVLDLCFAEV